MHATPEKTMRDRLDMLEEEYGNGTWSSPGELERIIARTEILCREVLDDPTAMPGLSPRVAGLGVKLQREVSAGLLEVYEKKTRPGFILLLIVAVTIPAGGLMVALDFPNTPTWLSILVVAMLYLGLIRLPAWRKAIPLMQKDLDELGRAGHDLAGGVDVSDAAARAAQRVESLVKAFSRANYGMDVLEGLPELLQTLSGGNAG